MKIIYLKWIDSSGVNGQEWTYYKNYDNEIYTIEGVGFLVEDLPDRIVICAHVSKHDQEMHGLMTIPKCCIIEQTPLIRSFPLDYDTIETEKIIKDGHLYDQKGALSTNDVINITGWSRQQVDYRIKKGVLPVYSRSSEKTGSWRYFKLEDVKKLI